MTNMPMNEKVQGRTDFLDEHGHVTKVVCVSLRQWNAVAAKDIFNQKGVVL